MFQPQGTPKFWDPVLKIIGSIISSVTPIVSIITPYLVDSLLVRLSLVCVFTMLFSVVMSLVTISKRVEIFAAAAALALVHSEVVQCFSDDPSSFVAVLVVFIGTAQIA